jgi:hypothetical protein
LGQEKMPGPEPFWGLGYDWDPDWMLTGRHKELHACGGSGYKRDMGLERYLRDGKAGWVMGPTNEVLRQFVGKSALLGFEVLDYWNQTVNERAIANETKKLDAKGKRALAEKLLAQAGEDEAKEPIGR